MCVVNWAKIASLFLGSIRAKRCEQINLVARVSWAIFRVKTGPAGPPETNVEGSGPGTVAKKSAEGTADALYLTRSSWSRHICRTGSGVTLCAAAAADRFSSRKGARGNPSFQIKAGKMPCGKGKHERSAAVGGALMAPTREVEGAQRDGPVAREKMGKKQCLVLG